MDWKVPHQAPVARTSRCLVRPPWFTIEKCKPLMIMSFHNLQSTMPLKCGSRWREGRITNVPNVSLGFYSHDVNPYSPNFVLSSYIPYQLPTFSISISLMWVISGTSQLYPSTYDGDYCVTEQPGLGSCGFRGSRNPATSLGDLCHQPICVSKFGIISIQRFIIATGLGSSKYSDPTHTSILMLIPIGPPQCLLQVPTSHLGWYFVWCIKSAGWVPILWYDWSSILTETKLQGLHQWTHSTLDSVCRTGNPSTTWSFFHASLARGIIACLQALFGSFQCFFRMGSPSWSLCLAHQLGWRSTVPHREPTISRTILNYHPSMNRRATTHTLV